MAIPGFGSHKVTHRDVKGTNILFTKEAGIKLVDFGISARFHNTADKRFTSGLVTLNIFVLKRGAGMGLK